jgi:hypothetical protein
VKNFRCSTGCAAIIAIGALLVVVMLWASVPLNMPFKFTLSWLKGAQTVEATTVAQLEKSQVRIGDTLRLQGTGTCNIHSPDSWTAKRTRRLCRLIARRSSGMTRLLPLPESDVVSKATALMQSVQRQLHPDPDDDSRVSPRCARRFSNQAWCCWMIWRYRH